MKTLRLAAITFFLYIFSFAFLWDGGVTGNIQRDIERGRSVGYSILYQIRDLFWLVVMAYLIWTGEKIGWLAAFFPLTWRCPSEQLHLILWG